MPDLIHSACVSLKVMCGSENRKKSAGTTLHARESRLHGKGSLGPESLHPVSNVNNHPQRPYPMLKKSLEANQTATQLLD